MRILFSIRNPKYARHFDSVLRRLAARGHAVDLVADDLRKRRAWPPSVERLARECPAITLRWSPSLADQPWFELSTRLRQALYFLRFVGPRYREMSGLRDRTRQKAPEWVVALTDVPVVGARLGTVLRWALSAIERTLPPSPDITQFIRELAPDVLVVSPLIVLRTVQLDLLRAAQAEGIPTVWAVASWDHLSSKEQLRTVPDRVIVWNDTQKREAVELHHVPEDRVRLTGAQLFDFWFARRPSASREQFCARVGLDPARPYVLYVCSSLLEGSPSEAAFVANWVRELRRMPHASLEAAGVLIRPHPHRVDEWAAVDLSGYEHVSLYPAAGAFPVDDDAEADYFHSMHFAAAVVGINTSAMVEAAILGRPVLTPLLPAFAPSQEGTLHFPWLTRGTPGLLHTSRDLAGHLAQLAGILATGDADSSRSRRFVEEFIRPHGREVEATGRFAQELEEAAVLRCATLSPGAGSVAARWLLAPFGRRAARMAIARREARRRRR